MSTATTHRLASAQLELVSDARTRARLRATLVIVLLTLLVTYVPETGMWLVNAVYGG